jgi:rhodanese-related sulfurtransferase
MKSKSIFKQLLLAFSLVFIHVQIQAVPHNDPIYLTNSKYRIEPKALNDRIASKTNLPVILNVSGLESEARIKGSLYVGDMTERNYSDLKLALGNTPKNKEIVVYCGCCSLSNCERVEQAFNLLRANGYTNVKVLNLVEGFIPDWSGKGYFMQ